VSLLLSLATENVTFPVLFLVGSSVLAKPVNGVDVLGAPIESLTVNDKPLLTILTMFVGKSTMLKVN